MAAVAAALRLRHCLVAFGSSALAMCCVVAVSVVVVRLAELRARDGWILCCLGVGTAVAYVVVWAGVALVPQTGSWPWLLLGAVGAAFGLSLAAGPVTAGAQLVGVLALGLGAGASFAGGFGVALVESGRRPGPSAAVVGWLLPVAGWPWLAGLGATAAAGADSADLTVPVPTWAAVVLVAALIGYGLAEMVWRTRPLRVRALAGGSLLRPGAPLVMAATVVTVALVGLGARPAAGDVWVRPLLGLAAAVVLGGLVASATSARPTEARGGLLGMVIVGLFAPAWVASAALVAAEGSGVPTYLPVVLAATGVAGLAAGWWRPVLAASAGPAGLALGSAVLWAAPGSPPLLTVAGALSVLGTAASLAAGLGSAKSASGPAAGRVALAMAVALPAGLAGWAGLCWALTGALPTTPGSGLEWARLTLGGTFAAAVAAAAYAATHGRRAPAPNRDEPWGRRRLAEPRWGGTPVAAPPGTPSTPPAALAGGRPLFADSVPKEQPPR